MTCHYRVFDRHGNFLGVHNQLETVMSIVGTGEVGVKFERDGVGVWYGLSRDSGAIKYLIKEEIGD